MSSKFLFLEPSSYLDAPHPHNIHLAMWVNSSDLIMKQVYVVPFPLNKVVIHGYCSHLKIWVELYFQHYLHETLFTENIDIIH